MRRGLRAGGAAALVLAAALAGAPAAADDRQALTAAYNETGQQLLRQFLVQQFRTRTGNRNIVFSPYSIGTAMTMVLAGARGDTEREMVAGLRLRLPRSAVTEANAAVMKTLNGYDRGAVAPTCPAGMTLAGAICEAAPSPSGGCPMRAIRDKGKCVATPVFPDSARLTVANALMLGRQTGDMISADYAALLKRSFAAEVFRNVSLDDVNGWVKARTEGKIEKLLDAIDPAAPAVILNAVYFKAAWRTPFEKAATAPADFRLTSSRKVQVPMMRLRAPFAVRPGEGYRAIRLPYKVAALSMTIVLPDRVEGIDSVIEKLKTDELARLLTALRSEPVRQVALALPRFKTQFRSKLVANFRELGMRRPFDLKQADFSGITGRAAALAPLAIQDVVHEAVIDVTEEGTEAAAATAIAMATTSYNPQVVPFEVDHPFMFVISDDATGAILFQGRIVDPR